ncbi:MAG: hypothetical protein ACT4O1_17990 [Gemmatimonadota bacterium]
MSAAIWAGLISGAVFMVVEMLMVQMFLGMSMWGPPRMIAAIVMGKGVLPPPETFDLAIVMVAMLVHFPLSVVFALPLAWIVSRLQLGAATGVGAAYGLALYLVNFYLMTAFFPWFGMARNWVSITAHILFGLIAAVAYKKLQESELDIATMNRTAAD